MLGFLKVSPPHRFQRHQSADRPFWKAGLKATWYRFTTPRQFGI